MAGSIGGIRGTIVKVIDGDTVLVRLDQDVPGLGKEGQSVSVRIGGILAPESETSEGVEAKKFLETVVIPGEEITWRYSSQDSFDRPVGQIRLPDGTWLSSVLADSGLVQTTDAYANSARVEDRILEAGGETTTVQDAGYGEGSSQVYVGGEVAEGQGDEEKKVGKAVAKAALQGGLMGAVTQTAKEAVRGASEAASTPSADNNWGIPLDEMDSMAVYDALPAELQTPFMLEQAQKGRLNGGNVGALVGITQDQAAQQEAAKGDKGNFEKEMQKAELIGLRDVYYEDYGKAPAIEDIKKAQKEGLSTDEYRTLIRSRPAFKKTDTYRNEMWEKIAGLKERLGY